MLARRSFSVGGKPGDDTDYGISRFFLSRHDGVYG
jgi:hypothetical protein